jgi:Acyltransferase
VVCGELAAPGNRDLGQETTLFVRVRSARAAEHINLVGSSNFGATCELPVPVSPIRLRPYSTALLLTSGDVQRSLHTITMPEPVAFVGSVSLRPYAPRACPSLANNQGSLRPIFPESAAPAPRRRVRAPHCCVPNAAMETPQEPARSKSVKLPSSGMRKFSLLGVLFLLCAYAWSILLIVPMIVAHPFVLALDRHRRRFHDFVSLTWMKLSMATTLFVPQVVNRANLPSPGSPCVYVANHTSYLDIFASAFLGRNIKFVSKTEIFRLPVIGWAMNMRGHIGVNRRHTERWSRLCGTVSLLSYIRKARVAKPAKCASFRRARSVLRKLPVYLSYLSLSLAREKSCHPVPSSL